MLWMRFRRRFRCRTGSCNRNSPAAKTRGSAPAPRLVEGCECRAGGRGCRRSHIGQPRNGHGETGTATTTTTTESPAARSSPHPARLTRVSHRASRRRDRPRSWSTRSPVPRLLCPQVAPTPPGNATGLLLGPGPACVSAPEASQLPRPRTCPCLAPRCKDGSQTSNVPQVTAKRGLDVAPQLPVLLQEQYPSCRNTNRNNEKVDGSWVFPSHR